MRGRFGRCSRPTLRLRFTWWRTTAPMGRRRWRQRPGREVLELNNPKLRGKGAALRHGFAAALAAGANAVLVVDADSVVSANLIAATRAELEDGAEATQCRYELEMPADGSGRPMARLRVLAFRGMNVVRAQGTRGPGLFNGAVWQRVCGDGGNAGAGSVQCEQHCRGHGIPHQAGLRGRAGVLGWRCIRPRAYVRIGTRRRRRRKRRWEGGRLRVANQRDGAVMGRY